MPYTNSINLDLIIQALYEDRGIFNMCNRQYDGFIREHGASEVRIPAAPLLEAVTPPATNRKKVVGDTAMISIPMQKSVCEIQEEVEYAYMNKSRRVLDGFIEGSAKAHRKNFEAKVIAEAQANGTALAWDGATVSWDDFLAIDAKFDELEVDPDDRFVVYPARIKTQVMSIDIIKSAMAYNPNYLEKGIAVVANLKIVPSARVGKIAGKENLVGVWGPGLAFLLDKEMDRKEAYDPTPAVKATNIDYWAWYGVKLLKPEYAVINVEA